MVVYGSVKWLAGQSLGKVVELEQREGMENSCMGV